MSCLRSQCSVNDEGLDLASDVVMANGRYQLFLAGDIIVALTKVYSY
jgi:hypothetical protein